MEPGTRPINISTKATKSASGTRDCRLLQLRPLARRRRFSTIRKKISDCGDVLFYGSIGRTDLPGGSYEQLVGNIKNKLLTLPEETVVYCGHGPETSIGFEKKNNPFLS
jgi:hypothetical protein